MAGFSGTGIVCVVLINIIHLEIKSILVAQPAPVNLENSPFKTLIEKYKVKVEYVPFIKTERVTVKEFWQQKVDVLSHTAVIFTSRHAIDNFFSICEEGRITVPETMKYFCVSESIALYLQKYIVYRKRKVFFGKGQFVDLMEVIAKHPTENFLIPVSEPHKPEISTMLNNAKVKYDKVVLSRTISEQDLAKKVDLKKFDLLLFYSPAEVTSLKDNFGDTAAAKRIAVFGVNTATAVREAKLNLVAMAPTPESPSMVMAVDKYLKKVKDGEEIDLSYIDQQIELSQVKNKKASDKVKVAKTKKTSKPKAAPKDSK